MTDRDQQIRDSLTYHKFDCPDDRERYILETFGTDDDSLSAGLLAVQKELEEVQKGVSDQTRDEHKEKLTIVNKQRGQRTYRVDVDGPKQYTVAMMTPSGIPYRLTVDYAHWRQFIVRHPT